MIALPKTRFIFDRRNIATREKKASVEIEVYYKRKRKYLSTGILLHKDEWSDKNWVKGRQDMVALNARLRTISNAMARYIEDLVESDTEFTFEAFIDRFKMRDEQTDFSFLDFIKERIRERENLSDGTKKHNVSFLRIFEDFGVIRSFSDLTLANIMLYDDFLHKRGIKQITVHSHHKMLKVFVHQAMAFGKVEKDPYNGFKVDKGKSGTMKYLTEDEFNRIRKVKLDESLSNVRDCFLFMVYTALAYSDAVKFDYHRDAFKKDGRMVFIDNRTKTDEEYYVVLTKPALDILRKHGYRLPWISNQKMNLYLKAIAVHAKVRKEITTHYARHTSAMMALNNGIALEHVSRMLGHADIKTTQIYAHMMQQSVDKAYDVMEKVWKKKGK